MSPEQQSLNVAHTWAAALQEVRHFFAPPTKGEPQYGAELQHPPAPAPTEQGSPSQVVCGDWQSPEMQLRPTQQGLAAEQLVPAPRQVVAPERVHTPTVQVRPAQQLPVAHG